MKFEKDMKEWNMFGELYALLKKCTMEHMSQKKLWALCVEFGQKYSEEGDFDSLSYQLACDLYSYSLFDNRKKFNYRVCAIIISNNKILAMHDERSPYFYLPGGRVQMGETAEHAVVREVEEELNITPKIIRPLWLNQSFFTEDVDKLNYHEICIYYLMDISETRLLEKGERFTLHEGHHIHDFEWLAFERLQDEYFYPIFLKTNIYNLPKQFTIRTEYE